jgi:hypothetical protein
MNVQMGAAATEARIVSRYNVAREVEALARVLAAMPWEDRRLIERVLIDSKATWLGRVLINARNRSARFLWAIHIGCPKNSSRNWLRPGA